MRKTARETWNSKSGTKRGIKNTRCRWSNWAMPMPCFNKRWVRWDPSKVPRSHPWAMSRSHTLGFQTSSNLPVVDGAIHQRKWLPTQCLLCLSHVHQVKLGPTASPSLLPSRNKVGKIQKAMLTVVYLNQSFRCKRRRHLADKLTSIASLVHAKAKSTVVQIGVNISGRRILTLKRFLLTESTS